MTLFPAFDACADSAKNNKRRAVATMTTQVLGPERIRLPLILMPTARATLMVGEGEGVRNPATSDSAWQLLLLMVCTTAKMQDEVVRGLDSDIAPPVSVRYVSLEASQKGCSFGLEFECRATTIRQELAGDVDTSSAWDGASRGFVGGFELENPSMEVIGPMPTTTDLRQREQIAWRRRGPCVYAVHGSPHLHSCVATSRADTSQNWTFGWIQKSACPFCNLGGLDL
jgi:hypothetical protein